MTLKDGWVTSEDETHQCYWKNGRVFGSIAHTGLCWELRWYQGVNKWGTEQIDRNAPADLVRHNIEYRASKRIV